MPSKYRRTPEQVYRYNRSAYCKAKFGLTPEQYDAFIGAASACEICGQLFDADERPCLDHNHSTGEVRGVLCGRCNKGIGLLRDCPSRLDAAADYLRRKGHNGIPLPGAGGRAAPSDTPTPLH